MDIDTEKITEEPWVYIFKNKSWKILYIWKAKNLKNRISQYFSASSVWKQDMLSKAEDLEFITTKTEEEAIILEINMIKNHKPPYNNLIKGEGVYTYIKITNETFPRIYLTRYKENDWAAYIWPKQFKNELKKLIQLMKKYFRFRNCKQTEFRKGRPCWEYFFGMCSWWCVYNKLNQKNGERYLSEAKSLGFIPEMDYEQAKKEYENSIKFIKDFFKWNKRPLTEKILDDINSSIQKQNFERAAILRDIYQNINKFAEKQTIVLEQKITWSFFMIKDIWSHFIYTLLYFFEWKLIDVIREKENTSDTELDDILAGFENELEGINIYTKGTEKTVWYSKNIPKIKKNTLNEIINQMEDYMESYILSSSFNQDNLINDILKWIQEKYSLKNFPHRIEFIDISHLSWWRVSWWLSCMLWGLLSKKNYRRYKIKASIGKKKYNNDYEALKEIIKRRFWLSKERWISELPDLFILDGGKWQLWIIKELKKEDEKFASITEKTDFCSLWKGKWRTRKWKNTWETETLFFLGQYNEIKEVPLEYDENDKILVKLRDEAHRFANKYRKKQMTKEFSDRKS